MSVAVLPPLGTNTPPPRAHRYTREQYARLGAAGFFTEKRFELIRGEIIDMGKEGPRHFAAFVLALKVIEAAFGPGHVARPAGPIALDDSEPQPDVSIVRGTPRDFTAAHPATVLFALEIAETSLSYDLTTKAELYATAGIPEYWVLDLDGRVLHVFRNPQPNAALGVTTYHTKTTHAATETVTPLGANAVKVSDLLP
jgi:Uma2 family endonuclease